jgi:hypothetical protein
MSFAGKCMELEIIKLSAISHTHKDKYHVFSYMWNLDLKKQTQHAMTANGMDGGSWAEGGQAMGA